jgi:hypothetical protein
MPFLHYMRTMQGIRRRHKRMEHKTAATYGRQEYTQQTRRQTLELEVVKLAVGCPVRLWKTRDRTLWRTPHPQPNKETNDSLRAGAVGALGTL